MNSEMTSDDYFSIIFGDHEDYKAVTQREVIEKRRWSVDCRQIFQRISDNTYWRLEWDEPATEQQENDLEFHMCQVTPVQQTITVYEKIE